MRGGGRLEKIGGGEVGKNSGGGGGGLVQLLERGKEDEMQGEVW